MAQRLPGKGEQAIETSPEQSELTPPPVEKACSEGHVGSSPHSGP